MGKNKYIKEIEGLFEKSPVVDSRSISTLIKSRKNVRQYPKQLIRNLIMNGKIKRLAKGCYTAKDDPSLAVFCFSPSYLGLQDALSLHNLWEQETIPVIITSRKVRQGMRKILGANVLIRRIDKKYLFGFDYIEQGFYLPYSDIEKTLIDMVYFKERINGEALEEFKKKIDRKKLGSYLKVYPKRIRKMVLQRIK